MTSTYVDFKGKRITRAHVLHALARFDAEYSDTNDYDNWLDKDAYQYALQYRGYLYPGKYILADAAGLPDTRSFKDGQETNSVFEQLGFTVVDKGAGGALS